MANERDRNQNQNTPSDPKDKNQDRRDPNTGTQGDRNMQGDRSSQGGQKSSQNPGQPDQRSKKPSDMNEDDDV
jgi:hypothetical protein